MSYFCGRSPAPAPSNHWDRSQPTAGCLPSMATAPPASSSGQLKVSRSLCGEPRASLGQRGCVFALHCVCLNFYLLLKVISPFLPFPSLEEVPRLESLQLCVYWCPCRMRKYKKLRLSLALFPVICPQSRAHETSVWASLRSLHSGKHRAKSCVERYQPGFWGLDNPFSCLNVGHQPSNHLLTTNWQEFSQPLSTPLCPLRITEALSTGQDRKASTPSPALPI